MSTSARASDIVFTRHSARRGLAWLVEAYGLFTRARLQWLLLLAVYYAIMYAVLRTSQAGQFVALLLKPLFAVGLLAAAWTQERGGRPTIGHLFQGFRANLFALIPLGIVFIVGVMAAIGVTALVDGGALKELMAMSGTERDAAGVDADRRTVEQLLASGQAQKSLFLALLLCLPTILANWFAPALVVFQDAGPLTALGASLRAAVANWRPLLVYALAVVLFGALLPIVATMVVLMLSPNEATRYFVQVAYLVYGLMFAAVLHIADYTSYRDVFHAGETLAPIDRPARES
jgi:hypothetical protein